ncbi:MAG: hypothetical protein VYB39_03130, partial [Pseudomonadota bacterium]|nr:hypothetical protein [Pseudomonadota bacterium]
MLLTLSTSSIVGHFSFALIPELQNIPSLNQLQQPLWYFGIGILIWLSLTPQYHVKRISVVAAAILFYAIHIVSTGLTTPLFISLFIILSAAFYWRRYTAVVATLSLLIMLFLSYGYVKYFSASYIKGEQVHIWGFQPNLSGNSIFASVNAATSRSSHALVLEKVTRKTPSEIPFAEYSPLLDAAINH